MFTLGLQRTAFMHKLIDNHVGNEHWKCTNRFTIYLKHTFFVNFYYISIYGDENSLHMNFIEEYGTLIFLEKKKYKVFPNFDI